MLVILGLLALRALLERHGGGLVTWGRVVLIKVVLLSRITAKNSIQGLELQTAGILETVEQVTSRTAMSGHVFVRVRGSYRGGTVVWWAHILKLFRKRSFISKNVMLSNFEPSGAHGHSQFSLGWGIYNWGQSDNQAGNNVHFIAL